MCFSPTVSFTASAGLACIGVATLRKTTNRNEVFFASIPLLFAAQQFIEGWLWLVFLHPEAEDLRYWLVSSYSVFAGIIWPVFAPVSIRMLEADRNRKNLMLAVMLVGVGMAVFTLYALLESGISAEIAGRCIRYDYRVEQGYPTLIAYIIATCAAFFISGHAGVRWIGLANISGFLLAYRFYHLHFVSVWCLFAAIVSGLIYFFFARREKFLRLQLNPVR